LNLPKISSAIYLRLKKIIRRNNLGEAYINSISLKLQKKLKF